MKLGLILSCYLVVLSSGCWFVRADKDGETPAQTTGEAIQAAAPFLPAPFGYIATAAGGLLSAIGAAAAKRVRDKAMIADAAIEAINVLPPEQKQAAGTAIRKQTRVYNVSGLLEELAAKRDNMKEKT